MHHQTRLTPVDGRLQVMNDLHAGGPPEDAQHVKPIALYIGHTLPHHWGNGTAIMVPLYAAGGGRGERRKGVEVGAREEGVYTQCKHPTCLCGPNGIPVRTDELS